MKELELMLLNMWSECGIEEIYKYKNRIKAFKKHLTNIELFYDLTYRLFTDVEDVANHEDSSPKEYKVSVNALIQSRNRA